METLLCVLLTPKEKPPTLLWVSGHAGAVSSWLCLLVLAFRVIWKEQPPVTPSGTVQIS